MKNKRISSQKKQAILFSFAIAFVLAASGIPRAQTPTQAVGQEQAAGRGQGRGQPGGQGRGGGAGGGQADPWPGKFSHLDEALALLRTGGIYLIDDLLPQSNWPKGHAAKVPVLIDSLERRSNVTSV